ncbi:mitotic spindle checkpoint protein Bub3 [Rhizina undulata]
MAVANSQPTPPGIEINSPPTDAISALTFSPKTPTRLLVSSWDKYVHLYDTSDGQGGSKLTEFPHAAAVLDCCYGESDGDIFSGGLDWQVKQLDTETSSARVLGSHEDSVSSICYNNETRSLISGSWDSTLRVYDPRASKEVGKYSQPHKIFSMSTIGNIVVVAMAARSVYLYDLRSMPEPWQRRESSLKFMTRTVRCMPNGQGYASSSIEGRVAVEFFDPSDESQKRKYAFKCHRQVEDNVDVSYPVNALAFHPIYGTFASGGGDGIVYLWDGMAKRRLRHYQRYPGSIAGVGFSCDGKYLAIGSSSGYEDGKEDGACPPESIKLYVKELAEGEGKGKGQ